MAIPDIYLKLPKVGSDESEKLTAHLLSKSGQALATGACLFNIEPGDGTRYTVLWAPLQKPEMIGWVNTRVAIFGFCAGDAYNGLPTNTVPHGLDAQDWTRRFPFGPDPLPDDWAFAASYYTYLLLTDKSPYEPNPYMRVQFTQVYRHSEVIQFVREIGQGAMV